ncbi:MAG: FGGY family carbohydrate kinase, partial [Planctomycetota bacterium]|nr:FGGY family carbohydrate kinase [Planctomycetota bacterium]
MSKYLAAIDQGTTSTRCILFSRTHPIASAQKEHRQILPHPGHVEHDPLEIWQATQEVIRSAIQQANINPTDIAAVGIANQRETTVLWDKLTGQPLDNAIVWQDTRTKEICDSLAAQSSIDRFRPLTGLPLATYFSAPKIQWILENVAAARQAADNGSALFGTIDSWLIWNLTGGPNGGLHLTDPTNASRTMLMNLATLDWDDSLLDIFHIPRSILPQIVPSSLSFENRHSKIGNPFTRPDGPFSASLPIAGILGDQQAALVGQTCFSPGQ